MLLLLIGAQLSAYAQDAASGRREALAILQKTSDKLHGLSSIGYTLKRELNYASEHYRNISKWSCYFHFDSSAAPVAFKYQIRDSSSSHFFNGTEKFDLDDVSGEIDVSNNLRKEDFEGLSYLYNSIVTLRNILPRIIANPDLIESFGDTIIDHHPCEVITLNAGKRRIQNLGEGFDIVKTDYNVVYRITIDRLRQMPVEILQSNDLNDDFIKTSFTSIDLGPEHPAERSWYYSSYLDAYRPVKQMEIPPLITVGTMAPDWTLPAYDRHKSYSLSQLRGKVILLEFWFKNCGPCIENVPHVKAINKKFAHAAFELLAINTWDSPKDIDWFCEKHGVDYTVLMEGENLAKKYGVSLFPTIIIIDKAGKVLYSGGFDQAEIVKVVEDAL